MTGPLQGFKVVELAGRGPGPFGAMILADLGADVIRIGRLADVETGEPETATERILRGRRDVDLLARGRRTAIIDLKSPQGIDATLKLIESADVLVEGFRPGVTERLGLGPDACLKRNPRLVYARMTGWGQDGPYAQAPGHDINYVALAGALNALRRPGQPPTPPLNLVGDFGGGGMLLVIGVLSALLERSLSGKGQVVDAAMIDGVSLLTTLFHGLRAEGTWTDEKKSDEQPGSHVLEMAAPFYQVYETSDGRYVSVGAGEGQFYRELTQRLGFDTDVAARQSDPDSWASDTEEVGCGLQDQDPDRMVRAAGRHRHLLLAGAHDGGSHHAPAQHRAADLRRDRRGGAAGGRSPVQPDAGRGRPTGVQRR